MFNNAEIKAAREVRNNIISDKMPSEIKSVYMAGEICMWDELTNASNKKGSDIHDYEYIIKDIEQGSGDFRSKRLYAKVESNEKGIVCSATLNFILRMYYKRKDKVQNYEEALKKFLDFYNT